MTWIASCNYERYVTDSPRHAAKRFVRDVATSLFGRHAMILNLQLCPLNDDEYDVRAYMTDSTQDSSIGLRVQFQLWRED